MPPLDDELRSALHGRAAALAPPADPFAGIERRARGIRRRRVGASVAGTALAVLAVAGVVPALVPDRTAVPADMATRGPSATAAPASPYALDLDDPWEYRGDRAVLGDGNLETWQREWSARRQGDLVPLFGQVWEPSGRPELVFASRVPGTDRVVLGVAQTSESGPRFLTTEREAPVSSVPVVVPGDEVARLLLVAAPEVERLQYAPDGARFTDLGELADGVATGAVEQAPGASDRYRVVGPDGRLVEQGPVPDEPARDASEPVDAAPANVQEWEPRGQITGSVVLDARAAYARERGVDVDTVNEKVLFGGDEDTGRAYLVGQFWVTGDQAADTLSVVVRGGEDVTARLYRQLPEQAEVVVAHLPTGPGQGTAQLLVVPPPGTGQVEYAGDEAGDWEPVSTPGLDGVVLVDRDPQAERGQAVDRLRLYDGDGVVTGTHRVPDLLCGPRSCD